jgi:excisionase family DNA binding protein
MNYITPHAIALCRDAGPGGGKPGLPGSGAAGEARRWHMNTNRPLREQPPRIVLQVRDVARRLDVTEQHVVDLIDVGLLPAINVGTGRRKIWRIPVQKFEAFLEERSAGR